MNKISISPIITNLKLSGYRITKARKAIIDIFELNHSPVSAEDINQLLITANIHINTSTLYREIDFLIFQNLIKPLQLNEKIKRYELSSLSHHHHLICNRCKEIVDFKAADCQNEMIKKITNDFNFTVEDHVLDFYGVCFKCSKILVD
jgi:Fur family transcriptional regulator, ferric uptake regulator